MKNIEFCYTYKNNVMEKMMQTEVRNGVVWFGCIVGFVQFINAIEFMIIAPAAPYLVAPFHLHLNQIGILTSAYTCSAIISGIIGFFYLDRFDHKKMLISTLMMLSIVNVLSIFCFDIYTIVGVRLVAGFFGGITLSLGMAILMSNTTEADRPKAYSIAMLAFPLVSIVGIPGGLWLSEYFGFKVLFISISGLIIFGVIIASLLIPSNKQTFNSTVHKRIKFSKHSILAMSLFGISQFPIYLLIPSLAIIMKYNMHVSSEHLPIIFMIGGIASLIATRLTGKLMAKVGAKALINTGTVIFILVLVFGLIMQLIPPIIFMALLMMSVYVRIIAIAVVVSKYPEPHQRAGFSALQSTMSNVFATLSGLISSWVLVVTPNMVLENTAYLAAISIAIALALPLALNKYLQYQQ